MATETNYSNMLNQDTQAYGGPKRPAAKQPKMGMSIWHKMDDYKKKRDEDQLTLKNISGDKKERY